MSWAADGQSGNDLHFDKIRLLFSSLSPSLLENSLKL